MMLSGAAIAPRTAASNRSVNQIGNVGGLLVTSEKRMAPRVGFEPTTNRLTADCSTTELPRNTFVDLLAKGEVHVPNLIWFAKPQLATV